MPESERKKRIRQLFLEVGEAHQLAFKDVGGADPEWPMWYAEYLQDKISDLLNIHITKSELVYLIVLGDKEQPLRAPGADYAKYYARFFAERYL